MKNEKNYMGFRKVWQILKFFVGAFRQAQTSYFWRVQPVFVIAFYVPFLCPNNKNVDKDKSGCICVSLIDGLLVVWYSFLSRNFVSTFWTRIGILEWFDPLVFTENLQVG